MISPNLLKDAGVPVFKVWRVYTFESVCTLYTHCMTNYTHLFVAVCCSVLQFKMWQVCVLESVCTLDTYFITNCTQLCVAVCCSVLQFKIWRVYVFESVCTLYTHTLIFGKCVCIEGVFVSCVLKRAWIHVDACADELVLQCVAVCCSVLQ